MLRAIHVAVPPGPPVDVQLWFGSAAARDAADRETREGTVSGILARMPRPHLELLAEVPIIIVSALPGGRATGGGGWYPPTDGSPTMDAWFNPRSQAAEEAPPDRIQRLRHSLGIIGWKDFRFLGRPNPADAPPRRVVPVGLAILHEVGHCVDRHLHLDSPPGQPLYRCGLRPYEGLRYGEGYNPLEFKAEAYARALQQPDRICRGNHSGTCGAYRTRCNIRLQTDLVRSPAFQMLPDPYHYLPQALRSFASSDVSAVAHREVHSQLLAGGHTPGPVGMEEASTTIGNPKAPGTLGLEHRRS